MNSYKNIRIIQGLRSPIKTTLIIVNVRRIIPGVHITFNLLIPTENSSGLINNVKFSKFLDNSISKCSKLTAAFLIKTP